MRRSAYALSSFCAVFHQILCSLVTLWSQPQIAEYSAKSSWRKLQRTGQGYGFLSRSIILSASVEVRCTPVIGLLSRSGPMKPSDEIRSIMNDIAQVKASGVASLPIEKLEEYLAQRLDIATATETQAGQIAVQTAEHNLEIWKVQTGAQSAFSVEMFKSVIEAGQTALKALMLMNGGAAAALGLLWERDNQRSVFRRRSFVGINRNWIGLVRCRDGSCRPCYWVSLLRPVLLRQSAGDHSGIKVVCRWHNLQHCRDLNRPVWIHGVLRRRHTNVQ